MTPDNRYRASQGSDYIVPPEKAPPRITLLEAFFYGQLTVAGLGGIFAALLWLFAP